MRSCLQFCLFFSFIALGIAADRPAPCTDDQRVPNNLKEITAVLGLCPQISELANPNRDDNKSYLQMFDSKGTSIQLPREFISPSDLPRFTAQAKLNIGMAQLSSASALLSEVVLQKSASRFSAQTKFQIAASIIGFLGGGVGGGLHLVNNPQVGHAATVLGISAGTTAAGLSIYSAIKYRAHDCQISPVVQSYGNLISNEELQSVCKNPQAVATILQRLALTIQDLQEFVLNPEKYRKDHADEFRE
jgi:hypothetical protein